MAESEPGQEPGVDDVRLNSLEERLRQAHRDEAIRSGKAQGRSGKGYSQGTRVLTELIAGPLGGTVIGWLLDSWLGTAPWLLLAMLFLGFGVAIRNIMRISRERPE